MDQCIGELTKLCQNSSNADENDIGKLLVQTQNSAAVNLKTILQDHEDVLSASLRDLSSTLAWRPFSHPNRCFKASSEVLQAILSESDRVKVSLLYLAKGVTIPQHGQEASLLVRVVHAGNGGKVGNTLETLKEVQHGSVRIFMSGESKMIQAGPTDPLILIIIQTGLIDGDFWYANLDTVTTKFNNLYNREETVKEYYESVASDYNDVLRSWGWYMPEGTVDAVVSHGGLDAADFSKAKVFDIGCGDGLGGTALQKRGFNSITGFDLCENMASKARLKGCYEKILLGDMMKDGLKVEEGSMDVIIASGVTSYLEPRILTEWLRVVKPGGIIGFTLKDSVEVKWTKDIDQLEKVGAWTKIWTKGGLQYLPSFKTEKGKLCHETKAKILVYKKN